MKFTFKKEDTEALLGYIGEEYSIYEALQSYFSTPEDNHYWQCAELVARFYKRFGIELPNSFTPSDVVHHILQKSQYGLRWVNADPIFD